MKIINIFFAKMMNSRIEEGNGSYENLTHIKTEGTNCTFVPIRFPPKKESIPSFKLSGVRKRPGSQNSGPGNPSPPL